MGSGRRARSVSLVYDLLAHLGSNVFMSFCIIIRSALMSEEIMKYKIVKYAEVYQSII